MNSQIIDQDIITLLGLESLPEEQKANLINKMGEVVLNRISLTIMDNLDLDDQKRLEALMKKNGDGEKVNNFLEDKIKNLDEIRMAEILKFKEEIVADAEAIKKDLGM